MCYYVYPDFSGGFMSRLHRDCYNVLRKENDLISQYVRSDNRRISLEIQHPKIEVISKIATRLFLTHDSAEILLRELGFYYYHYYPYDFCRLLPHTFDLDILSYQQNIIIPLSNDNFNMLNYAFIVRNIQNGARTLTSQSPSSSWNPSFSAEHEQLLKEGLEYVKGDNMSKPPSNQ